MSAKIPEIPPILKPKPEKPYESSPIVHSRFNHQKCQYEVFSVGERVRISLYGSKFLNNYGIYDGQVGKIVEIKKVDIGNGGVVVKIYIKNPLWHYELPDKDPTIMEFFDHEVSKLE